MRAALLLAVYLGSACGGSDEAGADSALPLVPDAAVADATGPADAARFDAAPCQPIPGGPIIAPEHLTLIADPAVDLTIAVPESYSTQSVDSGSADPIVAAGILDGADPLVTGFWLSLHGSTSSLENQVLAIDDAIAATVAGIGESHVVRDGSATTTHDGIPAWVDREVRVYVYGYERAMHERGLLLAQLLGRPVADLGLPPPSGEYVGTIVIRYSLIRRGTAQSIVMVAASDSTAYDDLHASVGTAVRALGGGSNLAPFGFYPQERCTTATSTAVARIDLITSDPSNGDGVCDPGYDCFFDHKAAFYAALFDELAMSGLDARVATGAPPVNPMNDADPNQPLCPGDAFIGTTPADRQPFLDCAAADGETAPLKNAEWMIERLLPRAEEPNRLRPDAQAVVVLVGAWFLTDEAFSPDFNLPIGPQEQAALDIYYLTREIPFRNAGVIVDSYVYLGDPSPPCPSVLRFGYPDVAVDLGGAAFDVCYEDPATVAQRVVHSAIAAASPFVLDEQPIVPSLSVVAQTGVLQPIPADGYEYRGITQNDVVVRGVPIEPGTIATIGTSFMVWEQLDPH